MDSLHDQGWAKPTPTGGVFLMKAGLAYCAAHASDLAAFPQFTSLTDAEKALLRKLWSIQRSYQGPAGAIVAFRLKPGAPNFEVFRAARETLQFDGLAMNNRNGFTALTLAGLDYCAVYAGALAAYPAVFPE